MLLSNSHLHWGDRNTYFEVQLTAPGVTSYGAVWVGFPVLRQCFTEDLGWTQTTNGPNLATLYRLSLNGRRLRVGRQHATVRRGAPGAQRAPGGWHGRRRAVDHSPLRARSRGGGGTWGDRRAPRPGRPGPTADHATRFRRARAGGGGARRGGGGPGAGIRHPARTLGRRGAPAPRFPGPARQRRAWRDGGDPHLGPGSVRVRQGSDRQRRYLLRRSGVLGPGPRRSPDRLRQLVACGIEARQRPTDAARIVCAAAYPSIVVILDAGRTSARWRAGIEPGEKLGIRVAATSQGRRP